MYLKQIKCQCQMWKVYTVLLEWFAGGEFVTKVVTNSAMCRVLSDCSNALLQALILKPRWGFVTEWGEKKTWNGCFLWSNDWWIPRCYIDRGYCKERGMMMALNEKKKGGRVVVGCLEYVLTDIIFITSSSVLVVIAALLGHHSQ